MKYKITWCDVTEYETTVEANSLEIEENVH